MQHGIEPKFGRFFIAPGGNLGDGECEGGVDLAGAKTPFLGVGIFDRDEGDLLELGASGVPVVRVFLGENADVGRPFPEGECAIAIALVRLQVGI